MSDDATLENQSPELDGNDDFSSSGDVQDSDQGVPEGTLETQPEPPGTDPLEEQRERSKLGRKVAGFEKEIDALKQTISDLTSMLAQGHMAGPAAEDDTPPVEYISTPEDLEVYNQWRETKEAKRRNEYANHYIHSIKSLSYSNPELHAEIENELLTNVGEYPTYSKYTDPVSDARRNYLMAENKILRGRLLGSQPAPNVRGGSKLPTGVSSTSQVSSQPKPAVKLDPFAAKFVRALGEDENAEWVQNSLTKKNG